MELSEGRFEAFKVSVSGFGFMGSEFGFRV